VVVGGGASLFDHLKAGETLQLNLGPDIGRTQELNMGPSGSGTSEQLNRGPSVSENSDNNLLGKITFSLFFM
jgi:hypothetical protein